MRKRDLAALHLPRTALAPQLAHRFDQQEQSVHPGVAVRQAATVGVDRETARGADPPLDKCPALALLAESQVLQKENRVDRESIVELHRVYISRTELGHVVGSLPGG